jgi:hypothetical protein
MLDISEEQEKDGGMMGCLLIIAVIVLIGLLSNRESKRSAPIPTPKAPALTPTRQLTQEDIIDRYWEGKYAEEEYWEEKRPDIYSIFLEDQRYEDDLREATYDALEQMMRRVEREDIGDGSRGYECMQCIKGNISYTTGERIYHFPGCEYYEATVINTAYGERWFSSEAEAIAAGWRKAENCP